MKKLLTLLLGICSITIYSEELSQLTKYVKGKSFSNINSQFRMQIIGCKVPEKHMKYGNNISRFLFRNSQKHYQIRIFDLPLFHHWIKKLKKDGITVEKLTSYISLQANFINKRILHHRKIAFGNTEKFYPTLYLYLLPQFQRIEQKLDLRFGIKIQEESKIHYKSEIIHISEEYPSVLSICISRKKEHYLLFLKLVPWEKRSKNTRKSHLVGSILSGINSKQFQKDFSKKAISLKKYIREKFRKNSILMLGSDPGYRGHLDVCIEIVKLLRNDLNFCDICIDYPAEWQKWFNYVLKHNTHKAKTFFTSSTPPNEPDYPKLQKLFHLVKKINYQRSPRKKIKIHAIIPSRKWIQSSNKFLWKGIQNSFSACKILEIYKQKRGKVLFYATFPSILKKSHPYYNIQYRKILFFSIRELLERLISGKVFSLVLQNGKTDYLAPLWQKRKNWEKTMILNVNKAPKIQYNISKTPLCSYFDAIGISK